jgi:hypothetical protein
LEEVSMNWSLSFNTLPNETIIEDSTKTDPAVLGQTYTVFLTTERVLFRLNAVGSSMTQSFTYQEIEDARVATRLLISYLCIKTKEKEFYIHAPDPGHWAARILETRKNRAAEPVVTPAQNTGARKLKELNEMLLTLQRYNLLTTPEVDQKKKLLEKLQL